MSYTKISNLFNIITQNSDYFKSYWAGYRHNVNENVVNNFNVDGNVGRLYPAVNWATPFGSSENVSDNSNIREDIKVSLYFDTLQGRDNCGNQTDLTLNEQIDELKEQAFIFLDTFKELCFNKYSLGTTNSNVVNVDINSDAHNDSLLVVRLDFSFTMFLDSCVEIDTVGYPEELPSCDLENYCDCSFIPAPVFQNEYSMSFDGVNELIKPTDNAFFNIDVSQPFTFSAWVKVNSLPYNTNPIISKYQSPKGYFLAITNTRQIRLDLQSNAGIVRISVLSNDLITLNTWTNIIITYNGTSLASGIKIYINGVESNIQITQDNLVGTVTNIADFNFGGLSGSGIYFDGFLNDFRAWDIVLNATEVSSEYNAGTPKAPILDANLLYRCAFGDGATFTTGVWTFPDEVNLFEYNSVNMDILNRVTDKP